MSNNEITAEQAREIDAFLSRIRGASAKKLARLRAALVADVKKQNARRA